MTQEIKGKTEKFSKVQNYNKLKKGSLKLEDPWTCITRRSY